jgi:hypothetical protein
MLPLCYAMVGGDVLCVLRLSKCRGGAALFGLKTFGQAGLHYLEGHSYSSYHHECEELQLYQHCVTAKCKGDGIALRRKNVTK